jgi:hypothetical protein
MEASMSAIYYGVVRNGVVVLPDEAQLDEGSLVEVRGPLVDAERPLALRKTLLEQRLIDAGVLDPPDEAAPFPEEVDFTPIEVKGKPLSEIIIEDRRS